MKKYLLLSILSAAVLFGGCGSTNEQQTAESSSQAEVTTTVTETEPPVETTVKSTTATESEEADETTETTTEFSIILEAGKENDYSEHLTLNADTEFEENLIVYYLPAGKYSAENITANFAQISVYSKETHISDEGWEEPVETVFVKLLKENETVEFEINEQQYIEIHEPDRFKLTLIK